ncbi:hypothetical protein PENANT_c001G11646 [Penicillium antarcticum]|uniref:Uncharacterized protein n=1 Tax=Penicillium antarcticum TaxID=416450 RepID=A0A1V6QPR6_9EURO|nr:hypothetical protein PENANT_c001G11646 [Penicillium antarcticum]
MADALTGFIGAFAHQISEIKRKIKDIIWPPEAAGSQEEESEDTPPIPQKPNPFSSGIRERRPWKLTVEKEASALPQQQQSQPVAFTLCKLSAQILSITGNADLPMFPQAS